MKVSIYFYGVLKKLAGFSHIEVEVEDKISIKSLIKTIIRKVDKKEFTERFYDKDTEFIKPDIIVLINDRDINLLGRENTAIKDGDKVVFIPSIHGG